jgi:hypothetical protein
MERSLIMTVVQLWEREQVGHPGQRIENRLTSVTVLSVQPDRHVKVPGSADLDHVPLAR